MPQYCNAPVFIQKIIPVINEYTSWVSLRKKWSILRGFFALTRNQVYKNKDEELNGKRKEKAKARR